MRMALYNVAPLHTSKRMHFIEGVTSLPPITKPKLAYVKTYALH